MAKTICPRCKGVFEGEADVRCPLCNLTTPYVTDYSTSDAYLKEAVPRVVEERKRLGLEGLVSGLECVIITTEPRKQQAAVAELIRYTGLELADAFADRRYQTCVLKTPGSADFLIQARRDSDNPFTSFNLSPKSKHLPNTRLETLVFRIRDREEYVSIQRARGVRFLIDAIVYTANYSLIQTRPSRYTGNSLGFIQWHGRRGEYATPESEGFDVTVTKPERPYLN